MIIPLAAFSPFYNSASCVSNSFLFGAISLCLFASKRTRIRFTQVGAHAFSREEFRLLPASSDEPLFVRRRASRRARALPRVRRTPREVVETMPLAAFLRSLNEDFPLTASLFGPPDYSAPD
jgi:hypothetical protein